MRCSNVITTTAALEGIIGARIAAENVRRDANGHDMADVPLLYIQEGAACQELADE